MRSAVAIVLCAVATVTAGSLRDDLVFARARVEQVRGLECGPPVALLVHDAQSFVAVARRCVHQGRVPAGMGRGQSSRALAALYDPDAHLVHVPRGLAVESAPRRRAVLFHEMVHAAQRHSGLSARLPWSGGRNTDLDLALRSLLEGDAITTTRAFQNRVGGSQTGTRRVVLGRDPGLAGWIAPYELGPPFVADHWRRHGKSWRSVDALYARPPLSTEHLLHPDRYYLGDDPWLLECGGPTLPGAVEESSDVMGELRTLLLLRSLAARSPERASEGWGGDRVWNYRRGTAQVLVWALRWDAGADAHEFAASYLRCSSRRYRRVDPRVGACLLSSGRWLLVARRGVETLIVESPTRADLAKCRLWWHGLRWRRAGLASRSGSVAGSRGRFPSLPIRTLQPAPGSSSGSR